MAMELMIQTAAGDILTVIEAAEPARILVQYFPALTVDRASCYRPDGQIIELVGPKQGLA